MKTTAITILLISLLGARLTAADAPPAPLSVEQKFQQADVELALEQYKKLRMAAFDLMIKLQTEPDLRDDRRKQLEDTHALLQDSANRLRIQTVKTAAVAVADTP